MEGKRKRCLQMNTKSRERIKDTKKRRRKGGNFGKEHRTERR